MIRIGVDVGGTNTDAALLDGERVVATAKTPTSDDVTAGIVRAVRRVLEEAGEAGPAAREVGAVMIGTTHFVNALLEGEGLAPTAALRLCGPATRLLPPFCDWPAGLVDACGGGRSRFLPGGHEFDGREIVPLDEDALLEAARSARDEGARAVAVTGVFSPVSPEHEERARDLLAAGVPELDVTLSHEIGRIGLLERESAAILNATLSGVAVRTLPAVRAALEELDLRIPLFFSQNDGTLMDAGTVARFPVLAISSGPTNSMRGAAFLCGVDDGVVVDIGGTTTDVGALAGGFPRPASTEVELAGVRTNFRMPDLLSMALGGGSRVVVDPAGGEGPAGSDDAVRSDDRTRADDTPRREGPGAASAGGGAVRIGPGSVGARIEAEARVFGGPTLTATDLAVAAGRARLGRPDRVRDLPPELVREGLARIRGRLEEAVDRMKPSAEPVPVILVGGGSLLVGGEAEPADQGGTGAGERGARSEKGAGAQAVLDGASAVLRPEHAAVANAIGAAIAQVGGEVDRVYSLDRTPRDEALAHARREARERAAEAGADPDTVEVVDVEEVPLSYLPGSATRLRVKAVGDLSEL